MRIELDESTGFLRVDEEGLAAVAAVVPALQDRAQAGEELDAASREVLETVGAVPGLLQAARSLSDPLHLVFMLRATREQLTVVRCWYSAATSAVVLPAGEDHLLFGCSAVQLPKVAADVLDLGAREGAVPRIEAAGPDLERLFFDDSTQRAAALDALQVPDDGWAWQVQLVGADGEELLGVLLGLDGPQGLRLAGPSTGETVVFEQTSPVDAWTRVIEFLVPESARVASVSSDDASASADQP